MTQHRAVKEKPDLTRQQYSILSRLNNGVEIHGERINAATRYVYTIGNSEDIADEVSEAALHALVNGKYIKGRIAGVGLAPPLRFSITEHGKLATYAAASAYDKYLSGTD